MSGVTVTAKDLARHGIAWPEAHPDTGEPFVKVEHLERRTERQAVHYDCPAQPLRQVPVSTEWVVDEDGFDEEIVTAWRDLTAEEWTPIVAAYEAAVAEWKRTGGVWMTAGQTATAGRFAAASGAWADGDSDGRRWLWREWGTEEPLPARQADRPLSG